MAITNSAPPKAGGATSFLYDGFISYSHAADDLLAPRLQGGLQRFAKPWWKRRAVRIFRDESSLAANPHLWSSITAALDDSGWFILLLSQDAASSEWVGKEIEYWVANKPADRILPVVTDGDFRWENGDVAGSSVPPALGGVFTEEPRWVDLRFAKGDEKLDLKNPEFSSAVADVASAVRGVPKDELASEEVRQHRRTVRTAWAAAVVLLVLVVVAGLAGIIALDSAAEAERQRQAAEESAALALEREQQALEQAAIAEGRRLLSAGVSVEAEDPELSILLATQAFGILPNGAEKDAVIDLLQRSAVAHQLLARIPLPPGPAAGQLSPDGDVVYHASLEGGVLTATDIASQQQLWRFAPEDGRILSTFAAPVSLFTGHHTTISVSPNGRLIAVAVEGDESPGYIAILDASRGVLVRKLPVGLCSRPSLTDGFSPGGQYLTVSGGDEPCMPESLFISRNLGPAGTSTDLVNEFREVAAASRAFIYDTATWEVQSISATADQVFESLSFSRLGSTALSTVGPNDSRTIAGFNEVVAFPTLDPITTSFDGDLATLAPSGEMVVFAETGVGPNYVNHNQLRILNVRTGVISSLFSEIVELTLHGNEQRRIQLLFSPRSTWPFGDSTQLSVVGSGRDVVFDVADGSVVFRGYDSLSTFDHSWSRDGALLLTVQSGEMQLWDINREQSRFRPGTATDDVPAEALDVLTRGFRAAECELYLIAPCPTLDQLRSG